MVIIMFNIMRFPRRPRCCVNRAANRFTVIPAIVVQRCREATRIHRSRERSFRQDAFYSWYTYYYLFLDK